MPSLSQAVELALQSLGHDSYVSPEPQNPLPHVSVVLVPQSLGHDVAVSELPQVLSPHVSARQPVGQPLLLNVHPFEQAA
jgi:hypothetical protein